MFYDKINKYKSWSNLKKQMNDLLCDSLKDRISETSDFKRISSSIPEAVIARFLNSFSSMDENGRAEISLLMFFSIQFIILLFAHKVRYVANEAPFVSSYEQAALYNEI